MPLHRIEVGNHIFEIICQEGEEDFLNSAAKLLDDEAQRVVEAQGRIGESSNIAYGGFDPCRPNGDDQQTIEGPKGRNGTTRVAD